MPLGSASTGRRRSQPFLDQAPKLDYRLAPSGLSLEVLQANPRGVRVPLKTAYEKCRDAGFATPSGKIEIFSTVLLGIGEPPLPEFRAPEELAAPWNKSRVRES
jgi:hypothetical protein